jgi:hypothetical protein
MIMTDRLRFNGGFWDGLEDARATPPRGDRRKISSGRLFSLPGDRVYHEGYARGFDWAGERPQTSDAAWKARQAEAAEAKATRKALRDARPQTWIQRF